MGVLLHIKAITVEHYHVQGVETKAVVAEIEDIDDAVNRQLESTREEAESDERGDLDIVVFDIAPVGLNSSGKQVMLISFGYAQSMVEGTIDEG